MAHVDPARAVKMSLKDRRKNMQDACREIPCLAIKNGAYPVCVVCVHEGKLYGNN